MYYDYDSNRFDKEIKAQRKVSKIKKITTASAWRFNDYGSASVSYCSMDRIYEAYNEYKENYNF